jgi:hypothetical protein
MKKENRKIKKETEKRWNDIMDISPFYPHYMVDKLFFQTFFKNDFYFTRESAPPRQAQPELPQPQPQLCQTHP